MAKVDSMQKQMSDISGEVEILESKRNAREIKNSIAQMKNAFDELVSRQETAEERIAALEDIQRETSKTEKQREQGLKKNYDRIPKDCGKTTYLLGTQEEETEKGTIFETIMTKNIHR